MVEKYIAQMWVILEQYVSERHQMHKMVSKRLHRLDWLDLLYDIDGLILTEVLIVLFIGCTTRAFSRDHKPDDPEESKVIIANNGRIDSYRD